MKKETKSTRNMPVTKEEQIEYCWKLFEYSAAFRHSVGFAFFSSNDELERAKKREDWAIKQSRRKK